MTFTRIAVVGPGLLGGSIALAVRDRISKEVTLSLWARREEAVIDLEKRAIADLVSTDLDEVVRDAQLIILATPIGAMADLVGEMVEAGLSQGVVITDVGSVKAPVVAKIDALLQGSDVSFVGSHPMAGSEQTGVDHAIPSLFEGAACVLTPGESSGGAVPAVRSFWEELGARVVEMPPDAHDAAVAQVSHLPHIVASSLVVTAIGETPEIASLAGAGFHDTTRVASGSPTMWTEIALQNREALRQPLASMAERLREVLAILDEMKHEELLRFLEEAKELRDRARKTPPDHLP